MFVIRLLLVYAVVSAAPGQSQTFEAATIKPSSSTSNGSSWRVQPGRITMENETIRQIIQQAYRLQDYQYSGPAWLEDGRYNVEAKAETKDPNQLMLMLQNLLAERFKLVVHRQSKPVSGYALVVAKGGLKIKPVDGEGSNLNSNKTRLTATHIDTTQLTMHLATVLAQPVVDETGVKDSFTFVLQYADPRYPADDSLPTIFTALAEQLGLKLEARKVPIEVLFVDHAERPIDN